MTEATPSYALERQRLSEIARRKAQAEGRWTPEFQRDLERELDVVESLDGLRTDEEVNSGKKPLIE